MKKPKEKQGVCEKCNEQLLVHQTQPYDSWVCRECCETDCLETKKDEMSQNEGKMKESMFCVDDSSEIIKECPDCIDKVIEWARTYQKERDTLLEALERIANYDAPDTTALIEIARRAIYVESHKSRER